MILAQSVQPRADFFGRVGGFIEDAGPMGLAVLGLGLVALLVLTVMNRRGLLLGIFFVALMFSGFTVPSVDLGTTLLRWLIMFLLAATTLSGWSYPGMPAMLFGMYGLLSVLFAAVGASFLWSAQRAGLMVIAAWPMAAAISRHIQGMDDIRRIMKMLLFVAGIYVIFGLASLPSLRAGSRFSGATDSAPLFVITGGLLMPLTLWGGLGGVRGLWKKYSVGLFVLIVMLCLISGQRTGTFAGLLGCVPLLLRPKLGKLVGGLLAVMLIAVVTYGVLHFLPEQMQFLENRYFSTSVTGRDVRWAIALRECLDSPIIGYGPSMHLTRGFGFHNAYLAAWHDMGVIGLLLYGGGVILLIINSAYLFFVSPPGEIRDMARLLGSMGLVMALAAFFETKLLSPSNILISMAILSSVLLARLNKLRQQGEEYDPYAYWEAEQALGNTPIPPGDWPMPGRSGQPIG